MIQPRHLRTALLSLLLLQREAAYSFQTPTTRAPSHARVGTRQHRPSCRSTRSPRIARNSLGTSSPRARHSVVVHGVLAGDDLPTTATAAPAAVTIDWSFLDEVYLITCPNADPGGERIQKTKALLRQVGLSDRVEVKEFETDDENRIRGCYTSHLSVLRDAAAVSQTIDNGPARTMFNPLGSFMQSLWGDAAARNDSGRSGQPLQRQTPNDSEAGSDAVAPQKRILVLEDNVALASSISQEAVDAVAEFTRTADWDIVHLSYIPYVPDLVISRTDSERIVKLTTGGLGSALGTTAYIINSNAIDRLIDEDNKNGFFAPIPDVMAKLFPESRFAVNPIVFVRAPNTKSLVNPQLDDLRQLLFQPSIASFAQSLLIQTGLSTNALLKLVVAVLLLTTAGSMALTVSAFSSILSTGSYDGPIIVPFFSSSFTLFALAVLVQGAMLAPKPPTDADDETMMETAASQS